MINKDILIELVEQCNDDELISDFILELSQVQQKKKEVIFKEVKSLRSQNQELQHKITKLTSVVSYELGSPLNSLKSMAELLMMDMSNLQDDMLVSTGEFLMAQIDALQLKMSNLIEWSNLENKNYIFTPESVDFHRLIEKSILNNQELAQKKSIEIQLECEEEICVTADKKMLHIIMQNLISNAVKYSKKGDNISIKATPSDKILQISVQDTGIGMGTAKLNKIYDIARPPQRGTANEQGLGLGLIIVKKMLELHDTVLQIETKRGEGSTFSFELPLVPH